MLHNTLMLCRLDVFSIWLNLCYSNSVQTRFALMLCGFVLDLNVLCMGLQYDMRRDVCMTDAVAERSKAQR